MLYKASYLKPGSGAGPMRCSFYQRAYFVPFVNRLSCSPYVLVTQGYAVIE
jgi:hypothetical protein